MQRLIVFSNQRAAQAFVDYMATKYIRIETKIDQGEIELWLADESKRDDTLRELQQFLDNPGDPRYSEASWKAGTTHVTIPYPKGHYWRVVVNKAGYLTLSVMALCAIVYGLLFLFGTSQMMYWLAFPTDIDQALEVWRWLTPAFIHVSVIHISFNLVLWWYIGGPIEKRLGGAKLLQILILSALASNYVQSLFSGNNFGGLSGVVYALIGYAWLIGERAPQKRINLDRSIVIVSVLWLFVGYFDILGISLANAGHIAGFVAGLTLAFWDSRQRANEAV